MYELARSHIPVGGPASQPAARRALAHRNGLADAGNHRDRAAFSQPPYQCRLVVGPKGEITSVPLRGNDPAVADNNSSSVLARAAGRVGRRLPADRFGQPSEESCDDAYGLGIWPTIGVR